MRTALLTLALALFLGACGASDEHPRSAAGPPLPKGDWGPTQPGKGERARPDAPPRKAPSAAVARALAGGTVGVVGVEGVIGVRPAAIDVSADAQVADVRWDRWDAGGAEGKGSFEVRDCDPTCASGGKNTYPATIRLSAPRLCGRAAYFDRARVELAGGDAPPAGNPTTYVRAPC